MSFKAHVATWPHSVLSAAAVFSAVCLASALTPRSASGQVVPPDPPQSFPRQVGGEWGPVPVWPHVPVSMANLPDGRVLTFASNEPNSFPGSLNDEYTHAGVFDPATGDIKDVPHPNHRYPSLPSEIRPPSTPQQKTARSIKKSAGPLAHQSSISIEIPSPPAPQQTVTRSIAQSARVLAHSVQMAALGTSFAPHIQRIDPPEHRPAEAPRCERIPL